MNRKLDYSKLKPTITKKELMDYLAQFEDNQQFSVETNDCYYGADVDFILNTSAEYEWQNGVINLVEVVSRP